VTDKTRAAVPEAEWFALLQRIAAGDRAALQALYLWTHRFVFAFIMGITNDIFAAEELTLMLYQDIWREAADCDPAGDTVLAWILNKARATALDLSRFTREPRLHKPHAGQAAGEVIEVIEGARKLAEHSMIPAIEDEPGMEERSTGIYAKLLAADGERGRLGMLVRLAAGIAYPPHVHAGIEQLYLLQGELWIDGRKLYPGDYNRAEPSTADMVVWSETGCTCILVTSSADRLA
jgi:DNA-directed RNA polymerase specialized sigma24 family protein